MRPGRAKNARPTESRTRGADSAVQNRDKPRSSGAHVSSLRRNYDTHRKIYDRKITQSDSYARRIRKRFYRHGARAPAKPPVSRTGQSVNADNHGDRLIRDVSHAIRDSRDNPR